MIAIPSPSLWLPRPKRIITDVLGMAHLKKNRTTGHLLKNTATGHMVKKCNLRPPVPCSCCTGGKAPGAFVLTPSVPPCTMNGFDSPIYYAWSGCVGCLFGGTLTIDGSNGFFTVPSDGSGSCSYSLDTPFTGITEKHWGTGFAPDASCCGLDSSGAYSFLRSTTAHCSVGFSCGTDEDTGDPFYTVSAGVSYDAIIYDNSDSSRIGATFPGRYNVGASITSDTPIGCDGISIPMSYWVWSGCGVCGGGIDARSKTLSLGSIDLTPA